MNPNLFAIDGMLVNIDDLNNPNLEGFLVNLVFAQASARSSAQKQLEAQKVSAFLNEISLVMAPPGPRAGGWSNSHFSNRGNKETFIKLLLTTASLPELTATFDNQSTDSNLSDLIKFWWQGAQAISPFLLGLGKLKGNSFTLHYFEIDPKKQIGGHKRDSIFDINDYNSIFLKYNSVDFNYSTLAYTMASVDNTLADKINRLNNPALGGFSVVMKKHCMGFGEACAKTLDDISTL